MLTKKDITAMKPQGKDWYLWCESPRGFGVRCSKNGKKTYILQYRNQHGRSRRLTIAKVDVLSVAIARQQAIKLLAELVAGGDPAEAREKRLSAPSMRDLCERYYQEHSLEHLKPKTLYNHRLAIDAKIVPALGALKVTQVTTRDVGDLIYGMKATPAYANNVRSLLNGMFQKAERWGWRDQNTNPVTFVDAYVLAGRERFLSMEELQALGEALDRFEYSHPIEVGCIKVILYTGARHSEIRFAEWDWIDWEAAVLRLPDSKGGRKRKPKPKVIPLPEPALKILRDLPRRGGLVFQTPRGGFEDCPVELFTKWREIRADAGLGSDLRIHDLRHSFASHAANMGISLWTIGKVLGHAKASTTERYAHAAPSPLNEASGRVASRLEAAILRASARVGGSRLRVPKRSRLSVLGGGGNAGV